MPAHRKPTPILAASGAFAKNPARARARLAEPKPTGPLGPPPEHFTALQRSEWHRLIAECAPGVVTSSDWTAMRIMARLSAKEMRGKISGGEFNQLRSLMRDFAMTPSSRSNVQVPPANSNPDPFANL